MAYIGMVRLTVASIRKQQLTVVLAADDNDKLPTLLPMLVFTLVKEAFEVNQSNDVGTGEREFIAAHAGVELLLLDGVRGNRSDGKREFKGERKRAIEEGA